MGEQDLGDPRRYSVKIFGNDAPLSEIIAGRTAFDFATSCWVWLGKLEPDGYARLQYRRVRRMAHVWAYEAAKGKIPEGRSVEHTCGNRACCNPDHIELASEGLAFVPSPVRTPKPSSQRRNKPIPEAIYPALREKLEANTRREGECLVWTGALTKGYGTISLGGGYRAHRAAYVLAKGPVPDGLVIDHLCRNRACCNPDHLEAVTDMENVLRGEGPTAQRAAATHCKWGHEFTEANTYISKSHGGRVCRQCLARMQRETKQRRRARMEAQDV